MISLLDKGVIVVYILLVIILGSFLGKSNKNQKDYFIGGRGFKWWAIGLSIIATQVSAVTFIGAPGWAYEQGLSAIILTLNIPLVMFYLGGVLYPFMYNSGVISIYEYIEKRFGSVARLMMVIAFLFKAFITIGTVLYAPALVLSAITGLGIKVTIMFMAIIAIFYTILGGIKAVIWTDVIQMGILWIGIIIAIIVAFKYIPYELRDTISLIKEAGKFKALDFTIGFDKPNTVWAGLIGGTVLHLAYFGIDQSQSQRLFTAKSMKHMKYSMWFSGIVLVIQMFLFMFLGCILFIYYKGVNFENPNDIFIKFAVENIPSGFLGLIIASIFAAAMSSLDSALNSMSTVLVKDIYERWINRTADDRTLLLVSRIACLICGILVAVFALIVSSSDSSVLEAVSKYASYLLGSMLAVFILGIYSSKICEKSVVVGLISGVASVIWVAANTSVFWMWYNLIGLITTIIISLIVNIFVKNQNKDVDMFTLKGQKKRILTQGTGIEEGIYIIPGKFEKFSYILVAYFIITMLLFYFMGS